MNRRTALCAASLITAVNAGWADTRCMPSGELEAALIDWYGERPTEHLKDGLVVWTSGSGETWTLVSYSSDGTACAIDQGTNWTGPDADLDQLAATETSDAFAVN